MVSINIRQHRGIKFSRLLHEQKFRCFYCGQVMAGFGDKGAAMTRDHLKPRCLGNSLELNMVLSCATCNQAKGCREPAAEELAKARNLYAKSGLPAFAF